MTSRERKDTLDESLAVLLAARAFGGIATIVRIAQQSRQDGFVRSACCCEAAIAVIGLAEEPLRQRIDDHVGGSGVEGDESIERAAGWNEGEVGDAAEVLQDACAPWMREESRVEQGDEWCALSAGNHI